MLTVPSAAASHRVIFPHCDILKRAQLFSNKNESMIFQRLVPTQISTTLFIKTMAFKDQNFKRYILIYLMLFLIFNLPINLTGIVISAVHWNTCGTDASDPSISNTLNVWIIVFCSVNLGLGILVFPLIIFSFWRLKNTLPVMILLLISLLFSFVWFIYGGVLLFGSVGEGCRLQDSNGNSPGFPVWQMGLAVWIVVLCGSCFNGLVEMIFRRCFAK
jgi:hypothetical protein